MLPDTPKKRTDCELSSMDKRCTDQGSSSDQGVLVHPVGSLHLLCEVRPSAKDEVTLARSSCRCAGCCFALPDQASQSISMLLQTLGLPTELFQIVLAKAAQQHGTASSLRLTAAT